MADETYLSDDLLRQLMSVGEVDLLVGILSHSSANTMRAAARSVESSLQQNFVRQRVAIISVDGGALEDAASEASADGQPENHVFAKGLSSLRTIHRITAGFNTAPSAGLALRTILASSDLLRAKATAVVSPATSSTSPDWIANLLRPAFRDNFDFVAPMYSRHKFQGLLARNLLYPMTRALFGRRIRELYSDEWGFSNRLGAYCLNQDVWHEEPIRTRPEAWMGISAMTEPDFRCCQVFLGEKPQPPAGSGRTSWKRCGKRWAACSGAWRRTKRSGWGATDRSRSLRSGRITRSARSRWIWIARACLKCFSRACSSSSPFCTTS